MTKQSFEEDHFPLKDCGACPEPGEGSLLAMTLALPFSVYLLLTPFSLLPTMLGWNDPVAFIHGLSPQQRRVLKTLEVETVGDLMSILPRRYDDYSRVVSIASIPEGVPVTIRAFVKDIKQAPTFRKRFAIIRATLEDQTGSIVVTWFNQPWLLKQLKPGDEIFVSGVVTQRPRFGRGFTSPLWEPATAETLAAGSVAPVYPLTGSLSQKTLRAIMRATLEDVAFPEEFLSSDLLQHVRIPTLPQAYRFLHRPTSVEQAEQGRRRFAFGELLIYQCALRMARKEADVQGAPRVDFDEAFAKTFAASLPFELTPDQKKAVWAAVQDIQTERPMRRLLQGDVGSGKTAVAAMLSALVFRAGASAVFMAPTDLLAKQHAATFERFFETHHIPFLLLTSSTRRLREGGEERTCSVAEAKDRLARGRIVAVGTHALLERGQAPPDIALAIVDEQHRFGVAQREALTVSTRQDGKVPHLLSMSATPIPRSLALTMLGDLDVSIIRTKPHGRLPIQTKVLVGELSIEAAYDQIRQEVAAGRRAFVVCPLIDPSDTRGMKSVEEEVRRLAGGALRGLQVGMVHGGMKTADKDETMNRFATGEIQVLVATTVVEVGVDIPDATVMLIQNAERFGLAQLHQLRGRVGRSTLPSMCFLATQDAGPWLERLRVLERTQDGFEVAEADLQLRGEGNLLGTQQSGAALFRTAKASDLELMSAARETAEELLQVDGELAHHPVLRDLVLSMRESSHRE